VANLIAGCRNIGELIIWKKDGPCLAAQDVANEICQLKQLKVLKMCISSSEQLEAVSAIRI
jgi:hypothetical protein